MEAVVLYTILSFDVAKFVRQKGVWCRGNDDFSQPMIRQPIACLFTAKPGCAGLQRSLVTSVILS